MDPLTAFGLAANVLAFVDFTAKVVGKANAIRKSSQKLSPEDSQVSDITRRLQSFAFDFGQSPVHAGSSGDSHGDKQLQDICRECSNIADELLSRLSRLAITGKISRFKSYRQALKSVWDGRTIDNLFQRLELFRGEINTYLLVGIR